MATASHGKQRARDWDAFSRNYHAESVTPFADGVRFRLRGDVRRLLREWRDKPSNRRRVFADFGCGPGDALELVAGKAPLAVGIDFAPKMLRLAQQRLRRRGVRSERVASDAGFAAVRNACRAIGPDGNDPRTLLVQADLRKLSSIRGGADAATSINSICAPNVRDATRMFRQMARSLRPGGAFFVVWPALESLSYLFDLDRRAGDPPEARGEVLTRRGVHIGATGYALKLFAAEEIRAMCDDAGVRIAVLEKVEYPWRYMRTLGWGDYPNRKRLWDWYLIGHAK